jgi:hypothetical protein
VNTVLRLLAILSLAGCSTLTGIDSSYPKGWPVLSRDGSACPELSGSYKNFADYSYLPAEDANSLAFRLFQTRDRLFSAELASAPGELRVRAWNDKSDRSGAFRLENGFACADGALWLPPVVENGADGTGGYRAERRLGLRRGANGNLVGEDRLFAIGAILWLVPIVGSQKFWYQWDRQAP